MARLPRKLQSLPLVAVCLIAVLAWLAAAVHLGWAASLDAAVAGWFDSHHVKGWDGASHAVFHLLGPRSVLIVAILCGALLSWKLRSAFPAAIVAGTVGIAAVVENCLKAIVVKAPWTAAELLTIPEPLLRDGVSSFPSGHVAGNAALLGIVAVYFGAGRNGAARIALATVVTVTVLMVSVIVLYVSAHCFSDVIGGAILGAASVAAGALARDELHRHFSTGYGRKGSVVRPNQRNHRSPPSRQECDQHMRPSVEILTRYP